MFFFFSSRRRHTRSYGDWSSDVCSSDLDLRARSASRSKVSSRNARAESAEYVRSEERRVGKECSYGLVRTHFLKNWLALELLQLLRLRHYSHLELRRQCYILRVTQVCRE